MSAPTAGHPPAYRERFDAAVALGTGWSHPILTLLAAEVEQLAAVPHALR